MLKDNLYRVIEVNDNGFVLEFDANHEIYTAHFPQYKVTPGVCFIQIAQELYNSSNNVRERIHTIKNLKLLYGHTPEQKVNVFFRQQARRIKAEFFNAERQFAIITFELEEI